MLNYDNDTKTENLALAEKCKKLSRQPTEFSTRRLEKKFIEKLFCA